MVNTGAQTGARGQVLVAYTEVALLTTTTVHAGDEALAQIIDMTTVAAHTGDESLADTVDMTTVAAHAADDALADTLDLATVATHTADDALAETQDLATVAAHAASEALAQTQDMTTVAAHTGADAIAQTQDLTTLAAHAGADALAETQDLATAGRQQTDAARISPGLGGTSRNAAGTTTVLGASVSVHRDDTDQPVASLTTDPAWATELDPAYTYWISYWKAGTPDRGYRTNRDIPPVETIVQIDAAGDPSVGAPTDAPYVLGAGDPPIEDIDGYLTPFGPQTGGGGDTIIVRKLYLFDD
ncbi:hypothetical protein C7Y72_19160 [Paraconexibacter algicola]|uniref:Uncharacterized protein n=1 Tax=Paraconexibacter algicola TaxID=2133960 RepID=A0A2T4UE10_9ACTN|nr:hypothetical protein C7Y72_19160 [Paraconexibacter algicola]